MNKNTYLLLSQKQSDVRFGSFIGKYFHFHNSDSDDTHKYFKKLPLEFIYFESTDDGSCKFHGGGKIIKPPFKDMEDANSYFVEIEDYKKFEYPVLSEDLRNYSLISNSHVNKLSKELYDEIYLNAEVQLNFTADSHLVQVLGEQLIASERVGILELVKNAYDANAKKCTVKFENIPALEPSDIEPEYDFDGPVIIVTDDGSGMSRDIITNGWLRPASTIKTNVKQMIKQQRDEALAHGDIGVYDRWLKEYKKANKGRLPLGEKGVGRFATHRLGKNLIIKTKTKEMDFEYLLTINWDDFDIVNGKSKDLDSIKVMLKRQSPSIDYGDGNSGTQLIIYGGREGFKIGKETIEEIYNSIETLNSPNLNKLKNDVDINSNSRFTATVICPQIGEFITESIYDLAEPVFTLDGLVNSNGILNYDILFNPPKSSQIPFAKEYLAKDDSLDLRKTIDINNPFKIMDGKYRDPECGEFYIHLDLWYRRSPWVDKINTKKIGELLDNYGGISIFRDSINLFPAEWGAEVDWLNLSKRHIKKGSNISYYNMMGYVELDQGQNIALVDKTDRQGLIQNIAFNDLSNLVSQVVHRAELDYIQKRSNLTNIRKTIIKQPSVLSKVSKQSSGLVGNIIDRYDLINDPSELFNSISSLSKPNEREEELIDLKRSLKELEKSATQMSLIQEQLIEEAGFGKAVAVSIHELAKTTTNLYNGIIQVLKSDKPDIELLNGLKNASGSLRSELKNLSPLRTIRNERRQEFDIVKSIEFVHSVFKRKFRNSKIIFKYNEEESFSIYDRYGAINQIFSNLIDNSVYWLETLGKEEENFHSKQITIEMSKKQRSIVIADNGPGIHDAILPYLFQSGASMRNPPSGLGLYICRYYMNRIKGDIYLASKQIMIPGFNGAQFYLDFSRSPKTKEDYK